MGSATFRAALALDAARAGIGRDIQEVAEAGVLGWVVLGLVLALPVVSLALLVLRRWLAVIPVTISLSLLSVWFLYYATDWWSNPGQSASAPAFLLILLGWLIVCVEIWRARRRCRSGRRVCQRPERRQVASDPN